MQYISNLKTKQAVAAIALGAVALSGCGSSSSKSEGPNCPKGHHPPKNPCAERVVWDADDFVFDYLKKNEGEEFAKEYRDQVGETIRYSSPVKEGRKAVFVYRGDTPMMTVYLDDMFQPREVQTTFEFTAYKTGRKFSGAAQSVKDTVSGWSWYKPWTWKSSSEKKDEGNDFWSKRKK